MVTNKYLRILNEDINAYIEDTGKENKVVLLHGFNSNWHTFDRLIDEPDRNFDIACFDFPGCGFSSSNNIIDVNLYQHVTAEFIKQINYQNCIVISHSLGALSALYVVKQNISKFAILSSPYNYYSNIFSSSFIESFTKKTMTTKCQMTISKQNSKPIRKTPRESLEWAKTLFDNNKFRKLTLGQMFNRDFVKTTIKNLYLTTDKFMIISGKQDPYVKFITCTKVSQDTHTELIAFEKVTHAFWADLDNAQFQIIVQLIEDTFLRLKND